MSWKAPIFYRLTEKEKSACKDIYFNYYLKVYIYAECLMWNQHDAEEITLSTLSEIMCNGNLHDEEVILSSIKQIVANKCFQKKPGLKKYFGDDLANNIQSIGKLEARFNDALLWEERLSKWKLLSRAEQKEKIKEYSTQFESFVSEYSYPYLTNACFERNVTRAGEKEVDRQPTSFRHFLTEDQVVRKLLDLSKVNPVRQWKRFKKLYVARKRENFKEQPDTASPRKVNYFSMAAAVTAVAAILIAIIIPVVYYIFIQRQYTYTEPAPLIIKQYAATGKEPELILYNGSVIKLDNIPDDVVIAPGIPFKKKGSTLYYVSLESNDEAPDEGINILSIPPARKYQIRLVDGSVIDLNASSQLHFPFNFSTNERCVDMKGEAFFRVKANPEKPFFVKLKDRVTIKVTGTSFNINAYNETNYIRTCLVEGRLQIIANDSMKSKLLMPGQQVSFTKGNFVISDRLNIDQVTAWKENLFSFENKSISEIMEEIRQYYNVKIIFIGTMPDALFYARISRSRPLSEILSIISKCARIRITINGDTLVVSEHE